MMSEFETEFELDEDGYPTVLTLESIENWSYEKGYDELFVILSDLMSSYGRCEKQDNGAWKISTGGWSGNESIIYALEKNKLFWLLNWYSSHRGGHYEFRPRKTQPPQD